MVDIAALVLGEVKNRDTTDKHSYFILLSIGTLSFCVKSKIPALYSTEARFETFACPLLI